MTDITNNSQYLTGRPREDENLKAIIDGINALIQIELINFAEDIEKQSSILTATGIWLDYIGSKLIFPRPRLKSDEFDVFGFDGHGVGFDQAPFWDGLSTSVPVSDKTYRIFLIARGGQLLTDCSIPSMDSSLTAAFGAGSYIDKGDMSLSVVIDSDLDDAMITLIRTTGLLTKPAGVRLDNLFVHDGDVFGFDGHGVGFDQAPFVKLITL